MYMHRASVGKLFMIISGFMFRLNSSPEVDEWACVQTMHLATDAILILHMFHSRGCTCCTRFTPGLLDYPTAT